MGEKMRPGIGEEDTRLPASPCGDVFMRSLRKGLLRLRARADHVRAPPGVPNAWLKPMT